MTVIEKKINVFSALKTNVLEDDKDMNELLKEVFELNGLPNVTFYTDSEVFMKNINENIHLCIVDQVIKGSILQGIDVMKIIRARFPKCQIIFMTGIDDTEVFKEALRVRPEGYVDKNEPQYITVLVDVLERCLVDIRKNMEFAIALENYKPYER